MTHSRVIDRKFPGIGRVRRVSGTSDAATHKAIGAMFTMLVKKGRLDLVRAWADGLIHAMDLYDRYRTEKLERLPSAETIRTLWTTGEREGLLDAWLGQQTGHTAKSVRVTWAALKALPQPATASVDALPALLKSYRLVCQRSGKGQIFKNARNNVRAVLRDTLGVMHPLYQAVVAIPPLDVHRKAHRPFTKTTLPLFLAAMAEAHGPELASMAQTLALTGMRPEEYWGEWEPLGDEVVKVRTAKQRKGKVKYRRVPTVLPVPFPTVARRTFEDKMREVTRSHVCYDLRRTFMHLMEEARIVRARRMSYLGHAAGDVSALYEEHEVDEYLTTDRAKLLTYLTAESAGCLTRYHTSETAVPL